MNEGRLGLRFGALGAAMLLAATIAAAGASAGSAGNEPATTAKKKCKKNRSAVESKKKCKKAVPLPAPTPGPTPTPSTPTPPTPASLSISPMSRDFGDVIPGPGGTDSPIYTFIVTNSGASTSGTLASSLGGTNPGSYTISSDRCNGAALGAGTSCTLDVQCKATGGGSGTKTATLAVTGSPGGSPSSSLTCNETT